MPGRLHPEAVPFAEGATEADPGEVTAAIFRSHGRSNVLYVRPPTTHEVKSALRKASSRRQGGLPRNLRKLMK